MRELTPSELYVTKLSVPAVVMRFYLTYQGPLPPTGNKPRPDSVAAIRQHFHPQMKALWEADKSLKLLRHTARVYDPTKSRQAMFRVSTGKVDDIPEPGPLPEGFVDLTAPIERGGIRFMPLVRKSLELNCELKVLFLRQGDPGALLNDGGEIDNRMKTLIDALRMPERDMVGRHSYPDDPTYVLMENDTLVWSFGIDSGRLLAPKGSDANEVHLVIEVIVRVLRLEEWNMPLMSN